MTRGRTWLGLLVAVLAAIVLWWGQGDPLASSTGDEAGTPSATPTVVESPDSGLPRVAVAELPQEAANTLKLIDEGGPFPYDRDGATFENREGILPDHEMGYYREYTVDTPGEDDRGARRIVVGSAGELYWTEDHYASFERIVT